jgi:hypothetical protein
LSKEGVVKDFVTKHRDKITGVISAFDRLIFKGYLPFSYPAAAEKFIGHQGLLLKDFQRFVKRCSTTIKENAVSMAKKAGRPYQYLDRKVRKEDLARNIAKRDGITKGLICVLGACEENVSFSLCYGKGRPRLVPKRPRCLTLYFYIMDPVLGFVHVRLSTWMPFSIQVYVNGHEWLARHLEHRGLKYRKVDNAFVSIEDCKRAQSIADRFPHQRWQKIFDSFAKRINPLMDNVLKGFRYYWVIDQAEFATDVLFANRPALGALYQSLQRHAALCMGAEDILQFLGRKLNGNFLGEALSELKKRWPGARIKHRIKANWMKMYDKYGVVLRIETVINDPYEFSVWRRGVRKGESCFGWFPMAKRVTNLYRYAEIGLSANKQYLNALAVIDDPTAAYDMLNRACQPIRSSNKRCRPLNLLNPQDNALCAAVMRGEFALRGFRHRDVAEHLGIEYSRNPVIQKRQSARLSRRIKLLHTHGLIAKIPRSRRYRVTRPGRQIMAAAVHLRTEYMPPILLRTVA